jgi:predicted metal-dependent peptidase
VTGFDSRSAAAKLAAARTRLIADKPFFGVLLLHLPFVPALWCETVATDAQRLYYNPGYIAQLSFRQTQFVLAHQALHCALGHFARRGHRVRSRWDAACDLAVNLLLVDEGLEPVADALIDPALRGLSAEDIYPLLDGAGPAHTFDRHLFDFAAGPSARRDAASASEAPRDAGAEAGNDSGADALGSDAAPQRRRNAPSNGAPAGAVSNGGHDLELRWQMRFAQAAQQARHAGRLSAAWQRLLASALEPPLPWRALIGRFVSSCAQEDYSFQRPARRDSEFLLPRLRSDTVELHAVLDTSGSIGEAELAQFATELDALKGQVRARVTVHACDCALAQAGPWSFEPWQPIVLPDRLPGGGGTDFRPVFEWLRNHAGPPGALLYFTDACGEFPEEAPPYPVLWLVKGNAPVPWGERIQFS